MFLQMGWWRSFLDSLDSDGGHIFVLLALMAVGMSMHTPSVVDGAFGALLLALKNAGSNKEQFGSVTSSVTVDKKAE